MSKAVRNVTTKTKKDAIHYAATTAARLHGEELDPHDEISDLQDAIRKAIDILTDEQADLFLTSLVTNDDSVQEFYDEAINGTTEEDDK